MTVILSFETAANIFPEMAEKANVMKGKQRSRERRKVREAATFALLKERGATCAKCPSFHGTWCDFHSDFSGKQSTTGDSLCLDFHGAKP